jgi:phosphatidylserine decarboxylase
MSFSVIDSLKKTMLVRPHPAGIPFIAGGTVAIIILSFLSQVFMVLALVFTLFCLYFFRDPRRVTPQKSSLVIAPADGIVSSIDSDVFLPAEIAAGDDRKYTRISIFLSVLDVHVNRIPVSGTITRKVYKPGKFLNADLDKASEENERCSAIIETQNGLTFCVVQIAGLIARRIVNEMSDSQNVTAGARFGIIRFGSRTDVYMPVGISALVCVGQRAVGGETVLADTENKESDREGVVV